jgi:hypothetical protein
VEEVLVVVVVVLGEGEDEGEAHGWRGGELAVELHADLDEVERVRGAAGDDGGGAAFDEALQPHVGVAVGGDPSVRRVMRRQIWKEAPALPGGGGGGRGGGETDRKAGGQGGGLGWVSFS